MALELETSEYFRDFDWGNLKAFYYVAKVGNISNAAHFLNLAQSSMSRQITGLEKQLGYPLFTRSKGGVKLTRKGEELLEIVENTFVGLKGFTHKNHAKIDKEGNRRIRIVTSHALAAYVINDLMLDYSLENPNLTFEIIGSDDILDVVLNDVDIAICPYAYNTSDLGIVQEPLFTLQKKLYASKAYLDKFGHPKTEDELKNHRLIAVSSNPEKYPYADVNWILKLGMPAGELNKPFFVSNSIECIVKAASKGHGIVSSYEEMSIVKEANLINILPHVSDKQINEYFIYPEYLSQDETIVNIKNYLQRILVFKDS